MLVAALLIGSAAIIVSAVGGYLMLLRIRNSSDFEDSAKAIFVADAGLECGWYNLRNPSTPENCDRLVFIDRARSSITVTQSPVGTTTVIKSVGRHNNAYRAFELRN